MSTSSSPRESVAARRGQTRRATGRKSRGRGKMSESVAGMPRQRGCDHRRAPHHHHHPAHSQLRPPLIPYLSVCNLFYQLIAKGAGGGWARLSTPRSSTSAFGRRSPAGRSLLCVLGLCRISLSPFFSCRNNRPACARPPASQSAIFCLGSSPVLSLSFPPYRSLPRFLTFPRRLSEALSSGALVWRMPAQVRACLAPHEQGLRRARPPPPGPRPVPCWLKNGSAR